MSEAARIDVPELVEEYLLDLVRGTRSDARLVRGVSTRGAQALHRAVRAHALVHGRRVVIPEDVRAVGVPVLAHRVLPRSGGGPGGDGGVEAIESLLDEIPPPL
jgi:MoxR-like ATPase